MTVLTVDDREVMRRGGSLLLSLVGGRPADQSDAGSAPVGQEGAGRVQIALAGGEEVHLQSQ
eukprot:7173410-Pyramimonas_sp.AAC.1